MKKKRKKTVRAKERIRRSHPCAEDRLISQLRLVKKARLAAQRADREQIKRMHRMMKNNERYGEMDAFLADEEVSGAYQLLRELQEDFIVHAFELFDDVTLDDVERRLK